MTSMPRAPGSYLSANESMADFGIGIKYAIISCA